MSPKIFTPLDPLKLKCRGIEIWGYTKGPCPPYTTTPKLCLMGMLDGWIRATKYPKVTDPNGIYNQEI